MDIIDISLGAKKAVSQLEDDGRVAKKTVNSRFTDPVSMSLVPNEELGGLTMAQVEGTLGVELTDTSVKFLQYHSEGYWEIPNSEGKEEPQPIASPLWYGNLGLVGMGDDTGGRICICVDFEQNASLIITSFTDGRSFLYSSSV